MPESSGSGNSERLPVVREIGGNEDLRVVGVMVGILVVRHDVTEMSPEFNELLRSDVLLVLENKDTVAVDSLTKRRIVLFSGGRYRKPGHRASSVPVCRRGYYCSHQPLLSCVSSFATRSFSTSVLCQNAMQALLSSRVTDRNGSRS